MLISLVAFALSIVTTHATPPADFCELEFGDHGAVPLVRIPQRLHSVDAIDSLFDHIDWAPLIGREIEVRQTRSKKTYVTSRQRFLSRDLLLTDYPDLRRAIDDLDRAHDERRRAYDRSTLAKAFRLMRPFSQRIKAYDYFYPGEFVSLVLGLPTGPWTSEVKSGFDQYRRLKSKLFKFDVIPLVDAMKAEIINYADQLKSKTRPRLSVYLVHNHPGRRPQPLTKEDLKLQRDIAEILSWWTDTFDFEVTMVALTDLDGPRDAAFVRTIDQSEYLRDDKSARGSTPARTAPARRRR